MSTNVLTSTKEEFEKFIAEEDVVLADFWASWCNPCKMLAPIIDQLGKEFEGKVKFIKIDVDKEKDLAMQYEIQSVPTVLIFKSGKLHARETGFKAINEYKDILNQVL